MEKLYCNLYAQAYKNRPPKTLTYNALFLNFFFLILLLLFMGSAPFLDQTHLPAFSLFQTTLFSLLIYTATLTLIYLQGRFWRRPFGCSHERFTTLLNIELITMFALLYFMIGEQRLFTPLAPFAFTTFTLTGLGMYVSGLTLGHYTYKTYWNRFHSVYSSVIFLLPFTIPFLLFSFINDLSSTLQFSSTYQDETLQFFLFGCITLIGIGLTIIFLPPILVKLWRCQPLQDATLTHRLDQICDRAHFTHAGFRVWSIMDHAITAAILGVVGRLRYVVFTPQLLKKLSTNEIEAILVHEIGHSHYKHLLIYPFILAGIGVSWLILSSIIGKSIEKLPEPIIIALFSINAWLYFRYIFGYFSRLFERQADLFICVLGLPTQHLIHALNSLSEACGGIHNVPNWHHFSIQERIDFLKQCQDDPQKIVRYQRKVWYSVVGYFLILATALTLLIGWLT